MKQNFYCPSKAQTNKQTNKQTNGCLFSFNFMCAATWQ